MQAEVSTTQPDDSFGLSGDVALLADMDGDTCEELVVARLEGGLYYFFWQDLGGLSFQTVQWGAENDVLFPPADINGDGTRDPVVIRYVSGTPFVFA